MFLLWIKHLLCRPRFKRRAFRPMLELLEDRVAFSAGGLDPTFGEGGRVTTSFIPEYDYDVYGTGVAVQPDGKVVVFGNGLMARYLPDGNLDPAFGSGGKMVPDFRDLGVASLVEIAVQPDGKILCAGSVRPRANPGAFTDSRFGAVRLNQDGSVDTSFGAGGVAWVDVVPSKDEEAMAIHLNGDGTILLAGLAENQPALVKLTSAGQLDPSLGGTGFTRLPLPGVASIFVLELTVQPDGKPLIASGISDGFLVARYLPGGQLDTTFGSGGWIRGDFGREWSGVVGVAVQPDGRILVGGSTGKTVLDPRTGQFFTVSDFGVARFLADGRPDLTFNRIGRVVTNIGQEDLAGALLLQRDGRIILVGGSGPSWIDGANYPPRRFAVLRYTRDGRPDPTFGPGGKVTTTFAPDFENASATAAALQEDGRLVVAGTGIDTVGQGTGLHVFAAARYLNTPDVQLWDATTTDFKNIKLTYAVAHEPVPDPLHFRVFVSADETLDAGDVPLPEGDLVLSKASELSCGPKGAPRKHQATFQLDEAAFPTQAFRFLIVKADPDAALLEADRENNDLFVLPILQRGFFGTDGSFGTAGAVESEIVGPIAGYVSRGTDNANRLRDFSGVWREIKLQNGKAGTLPQGQFPPAPYRDDNFLVNPALIDPITRFQYLVNLAGKRGRNRLQLTLLAVTAAYNEDGRHSLNSSHYEGRAIDFITNPSAARKLVGLGVLAGFGWADFEKSNHLHFSASADASPGGFTATVSAESLIQALDWGRNTGDAAVPRLVTDESLYLALRGLMVEIRDAGSSGLSNAQVRARIEDFRARVRQGVLQGQILQGFARGRTGTTSYAGGSLDKGLLEYNARRLLDQFPV